MPVCSLIDCRKELTGVVVGLADHPEMESRFEWERGPFLEPFEGENGRGVLLHPTCFQKVFDELMRQEGMTLLSLFIAPINYLVVVE